MKDKRLERIGEILKSVSSILSGVSSLLPWIKQLIQLIMKILQPYYWTHRLEQQGDVLFYEKDNH